jgi:LysR family transcriptional activator of nhaA
MPELNYLHLRYFRAVAHDGNLTRAAEKLNLSQSALSVQIRKLEDRLGHQLFERRGRGLVLTEAGRIALDHADAIFSTGDELLDSLREAGKSRRAVRVGALSTLSRNFLLGFLRPLLGRPDVEIVLRSGTESELLRDLAALNLDLAVMDRAPVRDALTPLVSHRLAQSRISLVGTPELVGQGHSLETLLATRPVILPREGSGARTDFDALADRMGIRPQVAAEVDDMAMMRLLAREGTGLAVLPPIVVKDELAQGLLLEADQLPGILETFYAVTLERKFPNPLVRELLQAEPPTG